VSTPIQPVTCLYTCHHVSSRAMTHTHSLAVINYMSADKSHYTVGQNVARGGSANNAPPYIYQQNEVSDAYSKVQLPRREEHVFSVYIAACTMTSFLFPHYSLVLCSLTRDGYDSLFFRCLSAVVW